MVFRGLRPANHPDHPHRSPKIIFRQGHAPPADNSSEKLTDEEETAKAQAKNVKSAKEKPRSETR